MLRNHAQKFVRYVKEEYSCMQFVSALAAGSAGMTIPMRVAVDLRHPMNRSVRQAGISKHRILSLRSRSLKVRISPRRNVVAAPRSLTRLGVHGSAFEAVRGTRSELVLPTVLAQRDLSRAGNIAVPVWEPAPARV
ncbi:MAG: hypothetical protein KDD66_04370 [Bdellovibrionales bacterium]|nr:hypothetical protein [Bdellovibrionales bacterium]